jgi:predicted PolB exonuclease-like 3'-5' exonuclease
MVFNRSKLILNSLLMTDLLILDIETVPQKPHFDDLSTDWQSLWLDKISKTMPENITPEESYRLRAGILAEFGKIVCISTAYFYEDEQRQCNLRIKSVYGDDETELLKQFTELCNKFCQSRTEIQFAGHNIKEFDIPYICRRLPLPACLQLNDKKPWETKMFDTMQWWKFGDYKNYVSLHLLASVLGIPTSKTDMDGSMVQDVYYRDNDLKRIVEYCQRDVVVTANVILRYKNESLLPEDRVKIVE